MKIRVLFFASARELAGTSQTELEIQPAEGGDYVFLSELRAKLSEVYLDLAPILKTITLAVNMEYIRAALENEYKVRERDEVALIPPISGG